MPEVRRNGKGNEGQAVTQFRLFLGELALEQSCKVVG
jgi:hypothetical protein